jgi:hypothetical protein
MTPETPPDDSAIFVARPLPRLRAWLALIFLGAGLLAIGGAIEFSTGSPMTAGQGASSYFAVLFGFHAAAFCGAAAIGAFPAIAVRPTKIVWLLLLALLYAAAFAVWRAHPSATSIAQWLSLSPHYAPALLPLVCGLSWGSAVAAETDS